MQTAVGVVWTLTLERVKLRNPVSQGQVAWREEYGQDVQKDTWWLTLGSREGHLWASLSSSDKRETLPTFPNSFECSKDWKSVYRLKCDTCSKCC